MVAALLPIACSTGEPPDEQTTTTGGPTGSPTSFPTTTDLPPTSTDAPTTSVGTTSDPSTASAGTSSSGTTGDETTGGPPGDLLCPTLFRFDPPPGGSAPRVAGEWQGFDLASATLLEGPDPQGMFSGTVDLPPGARIEVRRGSTPVRLVRLHQAPFTDRLVAKFGLPVEGWRGSTERRRRPAEDGAGGPG